ncbi:MAG TPA: ABC transporter permease [Bacteroidales bacterium]|nr:ABC transporter permease [Bacteroidales bacterium]
MIIRNDSKKLKPMFFRLLKEGIIFAYNSVIVNKLRTFLSLFGITIGIFSIISVFTVLDWMEKSIHDNIASMGEDVVYISKWPWGLNVNLNWWDIMKWPSVSKEDYQTILSKSTKSEYACFILRQGTQVKYQKNLASDIILSAVTHDYENIRTFEIDNGRYFTPEEIAAGKNIVVIGSELAKNLFDQKNPVGKDISVSGKKVTVIGVFKQEGKGGLTDNGTDRSAVVPFNFGKTFINQKYFFSNATLAIKSKPGVKVEDLSDEVTMILRAARRLRPNQITNFSVNRASIISQSFDGVFKGINFGGWLIGGFAILVGGFGIANIMFVSVRERTNQIGIQKALGAKRYFILLQFLVESVILSLLGGVLGLILIGTGTFFINYFYDLNMYLTMGNIVLALFISGLIGIVAGYAPAYSAARMNPVDAIGYSF